VQVDLADLFTELKLASVKETSLSLLYDVPDGRKEQVHIDPMEMHTFKVRYEL
jgi:hypothetical protein